MSPKRLIGARLLALIMVAALVLPLTGATSDGVSLSKSIRHVPEVPTNGAINPHRAYISRATLKPEEVAAQMDFEVALKMPNFAELQARVAKGERISPAEMEARFAPSAADYQSVVDWLTGQGFTITRRDAGRLAVFARGNVGKIAQALQITFARVALEGQEYTSATSAPIVPGSVAPLLVGINGLQPHLRFHKHIVLRPQSLTGTSQPYLPSQISQAYQANTLSNITGAGQTIAIVIDTFPNTSDLTSFWQTYSVNQSINNITFIQVVSGTLPSPSGEETLDTEWSSSIASGSKVRVYATMELSTNDLDQAYSQIYSDVTSQPQLEIHQMSMSYGIGEEYTTSSQTETDDQYFAELAGAGVTVFASSGDGSSTPGDSGVSTDTTGPLQVENPASDPNVTGVGGTSLTLNSSGNEATETAWSGSGGGTSIYFRRPSWQTGTTLPSGTMRLVPDVACPADPNEGAVLILNGNQEVVGGTSWSSPTWAGFCALMNQVRFNASLPSLGLLGPYLYPLVGTSNFRDITSGSNALGGNGGGKYVTAAGYDEVTGLGVPLVQTLSQTLLLSEPPLLTISPAQLVSPGQNATFSITATGNASGFSYQWQRLPLGTSTWTTLSDNGTYSGSATASLTVTDTTTAMSGDEFQCEVNFDGSRATTSLASPLVVDTPLTTVALAGSVGSAGLVNGNGTSAEFNYPSGIALDSSGNLYIADFSNNVIREVTPSGAVTTAYGNGTAGSVNESINAPTTAEFNQPNAIAAFGSTFYVADTGNDTIRKLSSGNVSTLAGRAGHTGSTNGSGSSARFNSPNGVAVDSSGNVYVADTSNNLIRKITSGGTVSTLAGSGTAGYLNGTGTAAEFNSPTGVAVDSSGNVYVADYGNFVVRKITSAGVVTTYAGQDGAAGYQDGLAADSLFQAPIGVWVDGSNNLYVSDSLAATNTGNNLLRRVTPAGVVSTIAGDPGVTGSANGTGTAAQFNSLQFALTNSAGVVYLVDTFNQTVRAAGIAPIITTAPVAQTATAGQSVTFSVTASGTGPFTYQWLFDGSDISGATGSSYTISSVSSANAGSYSVMVSDAYGNVTTTQVSLTVNAAPSVASDTPTMPQWMLMVMAGLLALAATRATSCKNGVNEGRRTKFLNFPN